MKKILLVITLLSFAALPSFADDTQKSVEELHGVSPTEKLPLVNEDGLEYFEPDDEDEFVENFEKDLAKHFDDDEDLDHDNIDKHFDHSDLEDEDFDCEDEDEDCDEDDFEEDDFDDEDFDDEDFEDDDEDLTGGELEDEDLEDDE